MSDRNITVACFAPPANMTLTAPKNVSKSPKRVADTSFTSKFPSKFWKLVQSCKCDTLGWSPNGNSVKILKDQFEKEYLQGNEKKFRTASFHSFVRQLHLYGFRKVSRNLSVDEYGHTINPSLLEYKHPQFIKGHPELLPFVRRRKPQKTNGNKYRLDTFLENYGNEKDLATKEICNMVHQDKNTKLVSVRNVTAAEAKSTTAITSTDKVSLCKVKTELCPVSASNFQHPNPLRGSFINDAYLKSKQKCNSSTQTNGLYAICNPAPFTGEQDLLAYNDFKLHIGPIVSKALKPETDVFQPASSVMTAMEFQSQAAGVHGSAAAIHTPVVAVHTPVVAVHRPVLEVHQPQVEVFMPAIHQQAVGVHRPEVGVQKLVAAVGVHQLAVGLLTPAVSVTQPAVAMNQLAVKVHTPAVAILQPAVGANHPAVVLKAPALSVYQPAATVTSPAGEQTAAIVFPPAVAVHPFASTGSEDGLSGQILMQGLQQRSGYASCQQICCHPLLQPMTNKLVYSMPCGLKPTQQNPSLATGLNVCSIYDIIPKKEQTNQHLEASMPFVTLGNPAIRQIGQINDNALTQNFGFKTGLTPNVPFGDISVLHQSNQDIATIARSLPSNSGILQTSRSSNEGDLKKTVSLPVGPGYSINFTSSSVVDSEQSRENAITLPKKIKLESTVDKPAHKITIPLTGLPGGLFKLSSKNDHSRKKEKAVVTIEMSESGKITGHLLLSNS